MSFLIGAGVSYRAGEAEELKTEPLYYLGCLSVFRIDEKLGSDVVMLQR